MARERLATKSYTLADGNTSRHAQPNATSLVYDFGAAGKLTVTLDAIPADNRLRAMSHGANQKITDSFAGANDPADAFDCAQSMYEQLCMGTWVVTREGIGPAPSLILAAIEAHVVAKGETVDDARRAKWRTMVADKAGRDKALANAQVKAHFERIKAERADARAKEAEKAAAAAPAAGDEF